MKKLRLILGDQLNHHHSWYQEKDENTLYVMMEMGQPTHIFDYDKIGSKKILYFHKNSALESRRSILFKNYIILFICSYVCMEFTYNGCCFLFSCCCCFCSASFDSASLNTWGTTCHDAGGERASVELDFVHENGVACGVGVRKVSCVWVAGAFPLCNRGIPTTPWARPCILRRSTRWRQLPKKHV